MAGETSKPTVFNGAFRLSDLKTSICLSETL
jgi:hypothetical protein